MTATRAAVVLALKNALAYLAGNPEIVYRFAYAVKTENYYRRAIYESIRDLYTEKIDADGFIDKLAGLIEDQFRRAWNEGARNAGFDPEQMTDEDMLPLIDRMAQEQEFMYGLADDVEAARAKETGTAQFQSRADAWANKYNEVRDWAQTHFAGKKRFKWVVDPEKEHCHSCLDILNGIVATGEQWEEARARGIYPQSNSLECGGYHCGCTLEPTDEPLTEGGIPDI